MKTLSKPLTYLGFALKANKLRTGINAINTLKSDVYLVVLSKDGEKNAVKEAKKIAAKFNCPLVQTITFTLAEFTGKENCKVAALTEENLAKAIAENLGEDFKVIIGD